jgi:hypothetical protein
MSNKELWFEFIPKEQWRFATDYLILKNWLPKYKAGEVVPSFKSVEQDKVEIIISNKGKFLEEVSILMASEIRRLERENKILETQVLYWRTESQCNEGRWIRALEDLNKF